jgi:hypothetical protein
MSETSKFWELNDLNPEAVVFEEFADAYVGYAVKPEFEKPVAVYDARKMLKLLAESFIHDPEWVEQQDINSRDGLEDLAIQAALEYLDYNTFSAAFGENGPIFLHTYVF